MEDYIEYFCQECGKLIAKIKKGSFLSKEIVFLCSNCYLPLEDDSVEDAGNKSQSSYTSASFEELFGNIFRKNK